MSRPDGIPFGGDEYIVTRHRFTKTSEITDVNFTGTNATAPTACMDRGGGGVLLTQAGADNDACLMANDSENIRLNLGPLAMYSIEFVAELDEATQADFMCGVVAGAYTITSPTNDFTIFRKDDGDTQVDVVSFKNGAGTTHTNVATFDTSTHRYRIDIQTGQTLGKGDVWWYIDDVLVKYEQFCTISDDEELKWMIGNQNGDGNARSCIVSEVNILQPNPRHSKWTVLT